MRVSEHQVVRHSCDNPCCCNPAHLLVGTQSENLRDMVDRGRVPRGYKKPTQTGRLNHQAKLTERDVRAIRASGQSDRALAKRYGVSRNCIRCVLDRATWAHVT